MVYMEKDKRLQVYKNCHKRSIKKSDIKKKLDERKKHVIPDHTKTFEGIKQDEVQIFTITKNKLERKRKEAQEKIEDLREQWQNLTRNELEFKKLVEDFNISTIEIRQKMEREKLKKRTMHENYLMRKTAINKIKRQIADYILITNELKKEAQKHMIYEDFLKKFAERNQYKVIGEILQRYLVLFNTREEMLHKLGRNTSKGLQFKVEYKRFLHRCSTESIRLLEELSQHNTKYDDVKQHVHYWEGIVYAVKLNLQSFWKDIDTTRGALEHVVSLLRIRLNHIDVTNVTCGRENLQDMLATDTGNLSYVNKRLGDLENLRKKLQQLIEDERQHVTALRTNKLAAPSSTGKMESHKYSSMVTESLTASTRTITRFPHISAITAKTLEDIRIALSLTKKWDKSKPKYIRPDPSEIGSARSSMVKHRSFGQSSLSESKRMSNWEFLKEIGEMTDEELMRSVAYLRSADRKFSTKREDMTKKEYTCTSLADPQAKIQIEKQINSRGRRIVEKNFDRYEKKFKNPLRRDSSSILKFNKDTGDLELPKLKYTKHQMPDEIREYLAEKESRKAKLEATLPQITSSKVSKIPRRIKGTKLHSTPGKYSKTKKLLALEEQYRKNRFEDLNDFLNIPAITHKYKTDDL